MDMGWEIQWGRALIFIEYYLCARYWYMLLHAVFHFILTRNVYYNLHVTDEVTGSESLNDSPKVSQPVWWNLCLTPKSMSFPLYHPTFQYWKWGWSSLWGCDQMTLAPTSPQPCSPVLEQYLWMLVAQEKVTVKDWICLPKIHILKPQLPMQLYLEMVPV